MDRLFSYNYFYSLTFLCLIATSLFVKTSAESNTPIIEDEDNEADRYYFNSLYQQQQAFQAQPLKQLRDTQNEDDGYYGYGEENGENEESQLIQRSVNSKLSSPSLTTNNVDALEATTTTVMLLDKSTENITIKVGQQAVLPCFISNLGSSKVIWAKSGDILALGTTKINSDTRLNIQHRYVSEWHLIIDNVATDDEGEYICKTNGNFIKIINLQVQMPPTIDDLNSTPAGTIVLKEGSSITLKCFADAKPEPLVKWYRWKKYKNLVSEKEELSTIGNELYLDSIKRNEANNYECIAKNSVPPATSRLFNIELHYLPTVELDVRKTFQFLHKKFSLECKVNSNPIDSIDWYKNEATMNNHQHQHHHKSRHNQESEVSHSMEPLTSGNNIRIDKQDISTINDYQKTLVTLTVLEASKHDFGEYQCCAKNSYGQICSNIYVQEIKSDMKQFVTNSIKTEHASNLPLDISSTSINVLANSKINRFSISKHKKKLHHKNTIQNDLDKDLPNILTSEETEKSNEEMTENDNEANKLTYEDFRLTKENNSDENLINSLDSKDKRRHYLIKSKQFLHLDSQQTISASRKLWSPHFILIISTLVVKLWL